MSILIDREDRSNHLEFIHKKTSQSKSYHSDFLLFEDIR
jgi:hypothetical protein